MAHEEPKPPAEEIEHDEPAHAFDTHEPDYKFISLFSLLCVALFVICVFAVWMYFDMTREQTVYRMVLAPPSEELKQLRAREDRELHTYGVADKEKGTVRIPIERAMELLAQEAKENRLRYPTAPYSAKAQPPAANSNPGPGGTQGPSGSIPGTTADGHTNTAPVKGGLVGNPPMDPQNVPSTVPRNAASGPANKK